MAVENDPIVSQSINVGSEDLVRTVEAGFVPALKLTFVDTTTALNIYTVRGNSNNRSFYVV
jgi:hypothetical protein